MNTSVKIAGVEFKNPVMTGSGTFGSGMEYGEFVDLNKLGAVVTKGVANVPWPCFVLSLFFPYLLIILRHRAV